eukprot:TRINITY_DN48777_c0_g1_i1.p1 TRINITY_DN48777_c0_g1~~TRINITY_DN48777_c0_g1_i1.p1  ORF type:complete len:175 (+),score=14.39 TRINITY_DN48777_c0_g1_i1:133-657(+)
MASPVSGKYRESAPLISDANSAAEGDSSLKPQSYTCWQIVLILYPFCGSIICLSAAVVFLGRFNAVATAAVAMVAALFAAFAFVVQWRVHPSQQRVLRVCIVLSGTCFLFALALMVACFVYAGIKSEPLNAQSTWLAGIWSFIGAKWAVSWGHVSIRRKAEGVTWEEPRLTVQI